jgi:dienelactone hydrolase
MDSRMRNWVLAIALLASALSACGSGSKNTTTSGAVPKTTTNAASTTTAASGTTQTTASPAKQKAVVKPVVLHASYVHPQRRLKTSSGKAPAVVLLPDTGNGANANGEAQKLAKLGVGALVVAGPPAAPTQVGAFNTAVAETLAAVKKLKAEPGVDPHRVGIVGEGVGAHVGAVAIGRNPMAITAAVLADIGGVVVPSPAFAPERWLKRAVGIQLLFQRDEAKRAMTSAEIRRLMLAAPPGTLMEQYKQLGTAAQKSRDSWIRQKLLAG